MMPDFIAIPLASAHIGLSGLNAFNPGIGLGYEMPGFEVETGAYLNSYESVSFYATAAKEWNGIGVFAGVATYRPENIVDGWPQFGRLTPVAGLQFTTAITETESLRVRAVPGKGNGVLTFQIVFE